MKICCDRWGVQASQVRFMLDGEPVNGDDTAEKLGPEHHDCLELAFEQCGGGPSMWELRESKR